MFEYRGIKLYNEDILGLSEEVLREVRGKSDLIVTSPPYNVGIEYGLIDDNLEYEEYLDFSRKWLGKCYDLSRTSGRLCLNILLDNNLGEHKSVGAALTLIAQEVGWKFKSTIIWKKRSVNNRTAWGSWKSASAPVVINPVELIILFYKDKYKKEEGSLISDITDVEFKAWTMGIWEFNGETRKLGHPVPFPMELPYRCIKMFSYVGDTVFDPFSGSGTTAIVAEKLGRKFIGTEINKKYFDLSINRIYDEIGGLI